MHLWRWLRASCLSLARIEHSIDSYIASERQRALDEVAAFLVANDLRRIRWTLRVEEGGPGEVISRAVAQMHPDLLVMGTEGRSALRKLLIASVTDEASTLAECGHSRSSAEKTVSLTWAWWVGWGLG